MARKFQYGADLRHQAVETALGDESPVGRQQRTPVHRAARFLNILVEVAPHGNMRAQMPQPQLIEDFLVLLIERRPFAAIHQVSEQEQLPKMRPSRLDQTVVENRGKIERAFQYNAVGFHRDEEVVQFDDRGEDAFIAHRSRKVEQHDIVSFFGDGGPFPPFRHRLGRFAAENTIRFHPFVLGE